QTVRAAVGGGEGFVDNVVGEEVDDGAEHFLAHDFHVRFDARQKRRLEGGAMAPAAGQSLCAARDRFLHPTLHAPCPSPVDQGADIGGGIEWITKLHLARLRFHQGEKRVVDAPLNIDALYREATLTGKSHRVARASSGGGGEVGVVVDDGRVVATQLEGD